MRHSLFVYDGDDGLVATIAPLLSAGLAAGESIVVVLEARKWELLSDALGSVADAISPVDRDSFYTRPEAALAVYDGRIRRLLRDGASSIRVFGEPRWDDEADWNAWIAYEAIVNRAFAHHPAWFICGYDGREVPEHVLDAAFETHPNALTDDWARSPRYHEPEEVVSARTPGPVPLAGLHALRFDGGARLFREALSAELEAAAVPELEADNMLIAAGEVLANAQRHGGATLSVNVGRVGERFVCEVSDDGPGIDDPLAGFLPPQPGQAHGAGLWVARQLTRQLELGRAPAKSSVRLWI